LGGHNGCVQNLHRWNLFWLPAPWPVRTAVRSSYTVSSIFVWRYSQRRSRQEWAACESMDKARLHSGRQRKEDSPPSLSNCWRSSLTRACRERTRHIVLLCTICCFSAKARNSAAMRCPCSVRRPPPSLYPGRDIFDFFRVLAGQNRCEFPAAISRSASFTACKRPSRKMRSRRAERCA